MSEDKRSGAALTRRNFLQHAMAFGATGLVASNAQAAADGRKRLQIVGKED